MFGVTVYPFKTRCPADPAAIFNARCSQGRAILQENLNKELRDEAQTILEVIERTATEDESEDQKLCIMRGIQALGFPREIVKF